MLSAKMNTALKYYRLRIKMAAEYLRTPSISFEEALKFFVESRTTTVCLLCLLERKIVKSHYGSRAVLKEVGIVDSYLSDCNAFLESEDDWAFHMFCDKCDNAFFASFENHVHFCWNIKPAVRYFQSAGTDIRQATLSLGVHKKLFLFSVVWRCALTSMDIRLSTDSPLYKWVKTMHTLFYDLRNGNGKALFEQVTKSLGSQISGHLSLRIDTDPENFDYPLARVFRCEQFYIYPKDLRERLGFTGCEFWLQIGKYHFLLSLGDQQPRATACLHQEQSRLRGVDVEFTQDEIKIVHKATVLQLCVGILKVVNGPRADAALEIALNHYKEITNDATLAHVPTFLQLDLFRCEQTILVYFTGNRTRYLGLVVRHLNMVSRSTVRAIKRLLDDNSPFQGILGLIPQGWGPRMFSRQDLESMDPFAPVQAKQDRNQKKLDRLLETFWAVHAPHLFFARKYPDEVEHFNDIFSKENMNAFLSFLNSKLPFTNVMQQPSASSVSPLLALGGNHSLPMLLFMYISVVAS
eukprot:GILK01012931.1.p1 GENE.GILK01012931.1~~GILK01012931.1.p1  ORF type:complete len:522 (-),score=42.98 GILK01012931.1:716-2281(-)